MAEATYESVVDRAIDEMRDLEAAGFDSRKALFFVNWDEYKVLFDNPWLRPTLEPFTLVGMEVRVRG